MRQTRHIMICVLGFAGMLVLFAAWKPGLPEFTPESWRTSVERDRDRLCQSLVQSGTLINMTENQVIQLLGEPDMRSETMIYRLPGARRRSRLSLPAIIFNLDRNGRVVKVGGSSFPDGIKDKAFDQHKWTNGDDNQRLSMARDLWKNGIFDGKTRGEVIESLGKPTRITPPVLHYCRRGENGRVLFTGKTLSIVFEDGKAAKVDFSGS